MNKCVKPLILITLILMPFVTFAAMPLERGLNYDPAHSQLYAEGFATGNSQLMQQSINQDLTQIKELGYNTIKTFYSVYSPVNGQRPVKIVPLVFQHHMKVLLGVFEFKPGTGCNSTQQCKRWTQSQVQAAIQEANQYPHTVIGIVIGNEDVYDTNMYNRIKADADYIRHHLKVTLPMGIGTAQTQKWTARLIRMYNPKDPHDLLNHLDFIGVNIYPFWGHVPWGPGAREDVLYTFYHLRLQLAHKSKKVTLIETEEGWPSINSLANQQAYIDWWKSRAGKDKFTSFLFATYDKLATRSADGYFGIYNFAGEAKNNSLHGIQVLMNNKMLDNVIVTACKLENAQKKCWPINGPATASVIQSHQTKVFKIDTRIPDYLLVIVDGNKYPAACIVPKEQFYNGNTIDLTWSPDNKGDEPCGLTSVGKDHNLMLN